MLGERAILTKRDGEIKSGLATNRWQQRIRLFLFDHLTQHLWCQWLYVRLISYLWIGHDSGRI